MTKTTTGDEMIYKENDLVTLKITASDAARLNGGRYTQIFPEQIIKHEPAPEPTRRNIYGGGGEVIEEKYPEFGKIARLSRECTITEKIDGSNGLVRVEEDGKTIRIGSRTRWITPEDDNYGFAKWCLENHDELLKLGAGDHYGEWWGSGIQKRYQNQPKTFSLFNTKRWCDNSVRPSCCSVVPVLYKGIFSGEAVTETMRDLAVTGSRASLGCMRPEGIIIWHDAARTYFKKTFDKDDEWKSKSQ